MPSTAGGVAGDCAEWIFGCCCQCRARECLRTCHLLMPLLENRVENLWRLQPSLYIPRHYHRYRHGMRHRPQRSKSKSLSFQLFQLKCFERRPCAPGRSLSIQVYTPTPTSWGSKLAAFPVAFAFSGVRLLPKHTTQLGHMMGHASIVCGGLLTLHTVSELGALQASG